jgi:hypothetical protein
VPTIADLRERIGAKSHYLVKVNVKGSGAPTLYFTDSFKHIEWSGDRHEPYLKSVPKITQESRRETSKGLNSDIVITIENLPVLTYDRVSDVELVGGYLFMGARVQIWEVFYDAVGSISSDRFQVFEGNVEKVHDVTEEQLSMTVQAREWYKDELADLPTVDDDTYPSAHVDDLGKIEPIVYGEDILIPGLKTTWGAESTLPSQINKVTASIEITNAGKFPTSGTGRIDEEEFTWTGKSGHALTGCTRGTGGTTASKHSEAAVVYEVLSEYKSLLSRFLLKEVKSIYAEIDGDLVRVLSGVVGEESGGKHFLKATQELVYGATADDMSLSTTQPSSTRVVRRWGESVGVNYISGSGAGSDTIAWPSAPTGTKEWVKSHYKWKVTAGDLPSSGTIECRIGGVIVAVVDSAGVKELSNEEVTIGHGSSWPSSVTVDFAGSPSGTYQVWFGVGESWIEAEIAGTNDGDPDGGHSSRPTSSSLPLTCTSSSNLSFPAAPSGTLGDGYIEVSWSGEVNTVDASNHHYLKIGSDAVPVAVAKKGKAYANNASHNPVRYKVASWQTSFAVRHNESGGSIVFKITGAKQVFNNTSENAVVTSSLSGSVIATHKITRLWALVDGTKSPASDYGTVGTTIKRPDYVQKHWIVYVVGSTLGNIDAASFNAAGTIYSTNSTVLGGLFKDKGSVLAELREMAHNAYSVVQCLAGTWYLNALPTSAPGSVDKTIDEGEMRGAQGRLKFDQTAISRVKNSVKGVYKKDYLTGTYEGSYTKTDVASGYDTVTEVKEWRWLRTAAAAQDATEQYVRERRVKLIKLAFPVSQFHLDLVPGSSIALVAVVWGGTKKFWVQSVQRSSTTTGTLMLLEWY